MELETYNLELLREHLELIRSTTRRRGRVVGDLSVNRFLLIRSPLQEPFPVDGQSPLAEWDGETLDPKPTNALHLITREPEYATKHPFRYSSIERTFDGHRVFAEHRTVDIDQLKIAYPNVEPVLQPVLCFDAKLQSPLWPIQPGTVGEGAFISRIVPRRGKHTQGRAFIERRSETDFLRTTRAAQHQHQWNNGTPENRDEESEAGDWGEGSGHRQAVDQDYHRNRSTATPWWCRGWCWC